MTRLLRCRFCSLRVSPVEAVYVADEPAHQECADGWYRLLGKAVG